MNPCYMVKKLPLLATCNKFIKKGKEITSEGLRHAFSQLKVNKSEGMPRNHEIYEALLTMSQEIED